MRGFLLDNPSLSEPIYGEAAFDFTAHAHRLAAKLSITDGPFTLGVHGPWGCGKTTYCKILSACLSDFKKQEGADPWVVWFNAWQYEQEDHPILFLLGAIVEKLKQKHVKLATAFRTLLHGLTISMKGKVPFFGEVTTKLDFDKMLAKEDALLFGYLNESLYAQSLESMRKMLNSKDLSTFKLYVFVDDLDRCDPHTALKLLEQIKLVLDLPKTVFILALNKRMLDQFVRHRYQKDYCIPNFSIERYVGKLIQLPIFVPGPKREMEPFIRGVLGEGVVQSRLIKIIQLSCYDNPRAVIRLANRLHYYLAQVESPAAEALERFCFQEGLRILAPTLFAELAAHRLSRDYLLFRMKDRIALSHFLLDCSVPEDLVKNTLVLLAWLDQESVAHPEHWLLAQSGEEQGGADRIGKVRSSQDAHPLPLLLRQEHLTKPEGQARVLELVDHFTQLMKKPMVTESHSAQEGLSELFLHLTMYPNHGELALFCYRLIHYLLFQWTVPVDSGLRKLVAHPFEIAHQTLVQCEQFINLVISCLPQCEEKLDLLRLQFGLAVLNLAPRETNPRRHWQLLFKILETHYGCFYDFLLSSSQDIPGLFQYADSLLLSSDHLLNKLEQIPEERGLEGRLHRIGGTLTTILKIWQKEKPVQASLLWAINQKTELRRGGLDIEFQE